MLRQALAVATLISALALPAFAQDVTPFKDMPAGAYQLDKNHASLTWKVRHMGLSNYTARFKTFDAEININPKNPEKSTVTASIDPKTIETDYVATPEKDFNKKLAEDAQWFNAGKYPKITFISDKIEITGENTAKIHGTLDFLGVKKPVVLDTVFNGAYAKAPVTNKTVIGFSATTTIKRSEWGMSNYVPMIGDDVAIAIETEFAKAAQ